MKRKTIKVIMVDEDESAPFTCPDCGATGKSIRSLVWTGYDVD